MLFTETDTKFNKVCLLCGHKTPITDIILFNEDLFVSISQDANVCGWSTHDASCVFSYNILQSNGEHHLSKSHDKNMMWLWTIGESAMLINVSTGSIMQKLKTWGLVGFSYILPENNFFLREPAAVCTEINCLRIYSVPDFSRHNSVLPFKPSETIFTSEYGLIKAEGRSWAVLKIDSMTEAMSGELINFGRISGVRWRDRDTICFSSYLARFRIIHFLSYDKYESVCQINAPDRFLTCTGFLFTGKSVIFSRKKANLCSINIDDRFKEITEKPTNYVYHVINSKEGLVVEGSKRQLVLFNWENSTITPKHYHITQGDISAITTQHMSDGTLQIVVGTTLGEIFYFWDNIVRSVLALSSKIIGFAKHPKKIRGTESQYAIGEDGSCTLLRGTSIIVNYSCNIAPIHRIYSYNSIVLFQNKNGSFTAYDYQGTDPLNLVSSIPTEAILIWDENKITSPLSPASTNFIKYDQNTLFYGTLDVNFKDREQYRMIEHMILKVLRNETSPIGISPSMDSLVLSDEPRMVHSTSFDGEQNNFKQARKKDTKVSKDLMQDVDSRLQNDLSLVLLGSNQVPTFFYTKYKLTGASILNTSPSIAVTHYICKKLYSNGRYKDDKAVPELIPIFAKYLFQSNKDLQEIAAFECESLIGQVPKDIFDEYLTKTNPLPHELIICAILVISGYKYSNIIKLSNFLIQTAKNKPESPAATFALTILIRGFVTWSEATRSDIQFFKILLDIYIKCERTKQVEDLFVVVAAAQITEFLMAANELMGRPDVNVKLLCKILSKLAFFNRDVIGTQVTLLLVHFCDRYPLTAPITQEELAYHISQFKSISIMNPFIVIGTNDGCVHVFKNYQLLFDEQAFQTAIDQISIGPSHKYAAALSLEEKNAKLFRIDRRPTRDETLFAHISFPDIEETSLKFEWVNERRAVLQPIST